MISNKDPLVSFVVPCYNYGRYLGDCLESIFTQDANYPFEIIAVDDASQDDTLQVLERFRDSRVRVLIHERNQGHIKTVTEGLQAARGKYVARIDPDDRYRSCFLSTLIPKLEAHPEVGMAYGDAALINEAGNINVPSCDKIHQDRDFKGNELIQLLFRNFICAPTAIARREAWVDELPLPPKLAFNDWYFNLMIARRYELYYVNRVVADYRVHSQNHHMKIVVDRSEETSIFYVLQRIFDEPAEAGRLAPELRAIRSKIYAAQYMVLADKYFGAFMNGDARRCYLQAVRHRPGYLFSPTIRRIAAALLGRTAYERCKGWLRARSMREAA
jgi:glycosyltransferase involved in cell wall biosynthesis